MSIYSINDNDNFVSFNEATGYETVPFTKTEDIPKEFKQLAIKVAETAEEVIGKKIGEGPLDAGLGRLFYRFRNTIDRIKKDSKVRHAYSFIIPQKIMLGMPGFNPKKYADVAGEILSKCQFKRGQSIDNIPNSYYYYKYSNDKKRIFLSYYLATGTLPATVSEFQLYVQCVDNTKDARNFLVESTSIFESIELI